MEQSRENLLKKIVAHWNAREFDAMGLYLSDDIELRSTNIIRLFPDSQGVIKGKQTVLDYMAIARDRIPNYVVEYKDIKLHNDTAIISTQTIDEKYNFHVQYFFRPSNEIYMIKSDLAEVI